MKNALHKGLWFIMGHFLSVTNWEPNFVPTDSKIQATTIWIWLPQLPIECYDGKILEKVGRRIGKLLKIDMCTSATLRGRYAWICIQMPIEVPFQNDVIIGEHGQPIEYEGRAYYAKGVGKSATFLENAYYSHRWGHRRRQGHRCRSNVRRRNGIGKLWNSHRENDVRER